MELLQAPTREYRTWTEDSRRWALYRPRADDIVIATYPKCGTTWTQRIVASLVFKTAEPVTLKDHSPWIDCRFLMTEAQLEKAMASLTHRRFFKSHLPLDGLPLYDQVKYIHVARDGRDAALSWHNHVMGYQPAMTEKLDEIGMKEPLLGKPFPTPHPNPADEFHRWLTESVCDWQSDGFPNTSYFHFQQSWWDQRHLPNLLMLHYTNLKADLPGEIHRLAAFLEIELSASLLDKIVAAASLEAMRRDAAKLTPDIDQIFLGGAQRFLNRGIGGRWKGLYRDEDLALYEDKITHLLTPDCAQWLEQGGPLPRAGDRTTSCPR